MPAYISVMNLISWSHFEEVDIRVGTIRDARFFEGARKPAYQLWIDFGAALGIKRSSAQITVHYTPENLINRQVVAVINFPPKQIANFFSECLVLGVYDENNDVVLLQPDRPLAPGLKVG